LGYILLIPAKFTPLQAGSLDWPEGWLFAAVLFAWAVLAGSWLTENNQPELFTFN